MLHGRLCGPRISTTNGAFSKDELVFYAVKLGEGKTKAGKMKMEEICRYLNEKLNKEDYEKFHNEWLESQKAGSKKESKKEEKKESKKEEYIGPPKIQTEFDDRRLCGPKKTDTNNAYTDNELIGLAVKYLGMTEQQARKTSRDVLCSRLKDISISIKESIKNYTDIDLYVKKTIIDKLLVIINKLLRWGNEKKICDELKKFDIKRKSPPEYSKVISRDEYVANKKKEFFPMNKSHWLDYLNEEVDNDPSLYFLLDIKKKDDQIQILADIKYQDLLDLNYYIVYKDKYDIEKKDKTEAEIEKEEDLARLEDLDENATEEDIEDIEEEDKADFNSIIEEKLDDAIKKGDKAAIIRNLLILQVDFDEDKIKELKGKELDDYIEELRNEDDILDDKDYDMKHFDELLYENAPDEEKEELDKEAEEEEKEIEEVTKKSFFVQGGKHIVPEKEIGLSKIDTSFTGRRGKSQGKEPTEECLTGKITLKPYQLNVVKFMAKNRGLVVWHSRGSGKTVTAVATIKCLSVLYPNLEVLWITQPSLTGALYDALDLYGIDSNIRENISVYTVQKFVNDFVDGLVHCNEKFIIIDEVHNLRTEIKAGKGKRAAGVLECTKDALKVMVMSADPIYNNVHDLINIMAFVSGTDPMVKSRFDKVVLGDKLEFEEFFKCKISYYARKSSKTVIPVTDKDVVSAVKDEGDSDFPTVYRYDVVLHMNRDYYQEYYNAQLGLVRVDKFGQLVPKSNMNAFMVGIRQVSNLLDNREESPKITWTINKTLDSVKKGKKVLIYSFYREKGINYLEDKLRKADIELGTISGDTRNRQNIVDEYNEGKVQVMLISKAGGEGINLLKTRVVIILEPAWNETALEQAEDRAVRLGSHLGLPSLERDVSIYRLYLDKPEERFEGDDMDSADIILKKESAEKYRDKKQFIERIIPLTIEQNIC